MTVVLYNIFYGSRNRSKIVKTLKYRISDTQFGFRNGMETKKPLFRLNVVAQRCMDMKHDTYLCYVDFEKVFDNVQHRKFVDILKIKNIKILTVTATANKYYISYGLESNG